MSLFLFSPEASKKIATNGAIAEFISVLLAVITPGKVLSSILLVLEKRLELLDLYFLPFFPLLLSFYL